MCRWTEDFRDVEEETSSFGLNLMATDDQRVVQGVEQSMGTF
jgi:hypothetical protein